MLAHAHNLSSQPVEAGGLQVQGQLEQQDSRLQRIHWDWDDTEISVASAKGGHANPES